APRLARVHRPHLLRRYGHDFGLRHAVFHLSILLSVNQHHEKILARTRKVVHDYFQARAIIFGLPGRIFLVAKRLLSLSERLVSGKIYAIVSDLTRYRVDFMRSLNSHFELRLTSVGFGAKSLNLKPVTLCQI